MTTAAPKAPAAQGAELGHLDDGQSLAGAPLAPVIENAAPVKPVLEGKDEELGTQGNAALAAEAAKTVVPEPDLTEYVTVSDPSASAAIALLKEKGVTPAESNAIFNKFVASGDVKDIDTAALVAKVGQASATLIINGATQAHATATAKTAADKAALFEGTGGEANWETVRTWAKAKEATDPSFKSRVDDVRSLLDKGGVHAEIAGRELVRMYDADPATKGLNNAKLVAGGKPSTDAGTNLTRADYVIERKKAEERGASQTEIAALQNRRLAGKAAGI